MDVIKKLQDSKNHVPQVRRDLNLWIREYVENVKGGSDFGLVWSELYREFKKRYRIDLKVRAKNQSRKSGKKVGPLDIASQIPFEEYGMDVMVELYALAQELFSEQEESNIVPVPQMDC